MTKFRQILSPWRWSSIGSIIAEFSRSTWTSSHAGSFHTGDRFSIAWRGRQSRIKCNCSVDRSNGTKWQSNDDDDEDSRRILNDDTRLCWEWLGNDSFKLGPTSFYLFSSFQTHITIFTINKCVKCPSSLRCRDSNSRPLAHESHPITTRPELLTDFLFCLHTFEDFKDKVNLLTNLINTLWS